MVRHRDAKPPWMRQAVYEYFRTPLKRKKAHELLLAIAETSPRSTTGMLLQAAHINNYSALYKRMENLVDAGCVYERGVSDTSPWRMTDLGAQVLRWLDEEVKHDDHQR